ncbi:T3SS effector HopA1 family protein [Streptomyces sp. NPDC091267]|uniref:T3SS effector HopA1 family protein n=1 Tax=Streptomyces sp. NPDC091267 TaxID=3155195 RepID=UPI00344A7133
MNTTDEAPAGLAPRVRDIIEGIELAGDATRALLPARELTAGSPRDMHAQLASAIYECFHAGFPAPPKPALTLRDAALESAFTAAVPHRHTPLTVPVVHAGDSPEIVVEISGVRVRIPRSLAAAGPVRAGQSVSLTWPAVNPAVSPGYFFVSGSRGAPQAGPLVRLYLHVGAPSQAPGLLADMLDRLESTGIPYRAKAGSVPRHYPRQDAMVVYLGHGAGTAVDEIAAALRGHPALLPGTSAFARRLAPGLATASEPADPRPGMRGMSFGEHRANVLAGALVEHALAPHEVPDRHAWVAQRYTEARIDPRSPADNLA